MNKSIKVLDLSYNEFSEDAVKEIAQVFEVNRSLEYLGLAKLKLTSEVITPLLSTMGRIEFPADQVEAHQAEIKRI